MSGNARKIYRLLAPFKFADLQTFCTLLVVAERVNISLEEIVKYVNARRMHDLEPPQPDANPTITLPEEYGKGRPCQRKRFTQRVHACPGCETRMVEYEVNTRPCNQVGEDYKTQWVCPKCETEEFE